MKFNFFKKKEKLESINLVAEKFKMTISDRLTISSVFYKNIPIIECLEIMDIEPKTLNERFNEAFYELKSENFNWIKTKKFDLSVEKKLTSTRVFLNGRIKNKDIALDVVVIVKIDKKGLFIEIKAKSNLKIYWGLSTMLKLTNGSQVEEQNEKEVKKQKRYEYAPKKSLLITKDDQKLLLQTTYGYTKIDENNSILLQPSLEGSDKEVINSWKINSDLKNHNVIWITEKIKR